MAPKTKKYPDDSLVRERNPSAPSDERDINARNYEFRKRDLADLSRPGKAEDLHREWSNLSNRPVEYYRQLVADAVDGADAEIGDIRTRNSELARKAALKRMAETGKPPANIISDNTSGGGYMPNARDLDLEVQLAPHPQPRSATASRFKLLAKQVSGKPDADIDELEIQR